MRWLIRCYQRYFSPLLGPHCRFYPTCSAYADEALARFGYPRGLLLACGRICRCHPWGACGPDPVPEEFSWRSVFRGRESAPDTPDNPRG